jgi:predicted KAP-like P-loop ATPase
MWPDNESDRDFLNFSGVAETVAEIIVQANGRPISIGISGAWGVGKSSMIRLTHSALSSRKPKEGEREFVFVDFNAWLYQGYDDARAALMDVIASELAKESQKRKKATKKVRELLGRVNWFRATKLTATSAIALGLGIPPIGLAGELWGIGRKLLAGEVDGEVLKGAQEGAEKVGEASEGLWKPKPDSTPPKEIQELRDAFEETLAELGVTLVVLIDDLDRCLPETTISTLEAIRLFLFLKNTAFVIAADDAMIKYAVRRHFKDLSDENLVTNYFDKLIQVPIRVPPLGTQEVRAYMMLLFVENSDLTLDVKEKIRSAVCAQLRQSWQGKRVDRAFIAAQANLPTPLIGKLDAAELLAPLMVSATKIAANPRLIKRFMNALAIRMAIAKGHGVSVDEAVLAKLLLFERLAPSDVYAELATKVAEHAEGKPTFLAEWEAAAAAGDAPKLPEKWTQPFILEWLALPPALANTDLRGALYVSREHAPLITAEDRLSSESAELLKALLENPTSAAAFKDRLAKIPRIETPLIMDRLLARAREEQSWGTPGILDACLVMTEADPALGKRLASFLQERPATQIQANLVMKISGRSWADEVFAAWEKVSVSGPVKKAIKLARDNGNVTV